ncbi:DUF4190 domain-containing protein [Mycobacterium rhizamassiliense]|uniref:DUF4190 domain-containing protein n=1 Tax=Mycobacterium rhizamassiliense TaxID=1841860 RepID=UPI001FE9E955|nr:DUF4190 domain-containing protein [Mycobacterium rhizamassiliense]
MTSNRLTTPRRPRVTTQPPNYPPPPPGDYPPPGPGYPPPGPGYPPPGQPAAGTNTLAIASLVSSLLGWLCGIGPILGLIFGFIALNQIKKTGEGGRGLALAGIIIGAIAIVLGIIYGIIVGIAAVNQPQVQTSSSAPPAVVLTVDQPVAAAFAA